MSRIDEIFDDYYTPMKLPDNNRSKLKKKFLEAILECIGEDEKHPAGTPRFDMLEKMARNELRQEIRNAIKDMFGEHIEPHLNLDSYIDKDTKNV
jgi:hypothetical protein